MRTSDTPRLALMVALALGGAAYGQVPASNDTSDANGNTGMGTEAMGGPANTAGGTNNTGVGYQALYSNASAGADAGSNNTGLGAFALAGNTTGNWNTALGAFALSAFGGTALTGSNNTAAGYVALGADTTGFSNTATGAFALGDNTTGAFNAAFGDGALQSNNANDNTAMGHAVLTANTSGTANTAVGSGALQTNTTGNNNTAFGNAALFSNTKGSNNIAVGFQAGYKLTAGGNNIDIGNEGAAGDKNLIRIGTAGTQTTTFIAGIYHVTSVSGLPVVIASNGELGTTSSSVRFKTAIAPMGSRTAKLHDLHPVTFRYKTDPTGTLRYGLIAEEVAKVYPELVVRDSTGRIDGLCTDELTPMLLNEIQRQDAELDQLTKQFAVARAALVKLHPSGQLVAQR